MSIPEAAIEAAAEAVTAHYDGPASCNGIGFCNEAVARAAIEAAMPAIREAIAQEIEKIADNTDRRMIDDANGNWWAYEPLRLREWIDAARIVRGGAA